MTTDLGSTRRLVIRSRYFQVVGGGVAVGAGIYGIVTGLSEPDASVLFAVVWGALCSVLLCRLVRVALIDDGEALTLRNVFSTSRISWSDVEALRVVALAGKGYTAGVAFDVRGRRRRKVASGTVVYTKATAEWICRTLERHASDHGVAAALDPAELRSGF